MFSEVRGKSETVGHVASLPLWEWTPLVQLVHFDDALA